MLCFRKNNFEDSRYKKKNSYNSLLIILLSLNLFTPYPQGCEKLLKPLIRRTAIPKHTSLSFLYGNALSSPTIKKVVKYPLSPYYSNITGKNPSQRYFHTSENKIFAMNYELLKNNFDIIVPANGLKEKLDFSLKNNRPLNVKLGFDPTAPDLHLGHAVVLKKLKQFQDAGCTLKIIIGDFTACLGDPTGRNKTRPPLSRDEVKRNADTYLSQLSKIIDISKADIVFNSSWLDSLKFSEIIDIFSKLTVSQIMQRKDFDNRYTNNIPISFHELIYPIMQGYDSVMIDADIEIGGTDQLFNCMIGRTLQSAMGKNTQIVACMPILTGTDGKLKMGKSLNNYIGLTEDPKNIFGKVMSIADELIPEYIKLASDFSEEEKQHKLKNLAQPEINPMSIKKELAENIVKQYYDAHIAKDAAEVFYKQVQRKNIESNDYIEISLQNLNVREDTLTIISLCHKLPLGMSKGEVRRIIEGGGVTINNVKISDPNSTVDLINLKEDKEIKIKIGKRNFYKIIL